MKTYESIIESKVQNTDTSESDDKYDFKGKNEKSIFNKMYFNEPGESEKKNVSGMACFSKPGENESENTFDMARLDKLCAVSKQNMDDMDDLINNSHDSSYHQRRSIGQN